MWLAAILMCQFVSYGGWLSFSISFHFDGDLMREKGRKRQDRAFGAYKESNMPTTWCHLVSIPRGLLIHTARIQLTAVWCKVINEEYCYRMMTKIDVVAVLLWEYSCFIARQTAIRLHLLNYIVPSVFLSYLLNTSQRKKQRKENKGDFPL